MQSRDVKRGVEKKRKRRGEREEEKEKRRKRRGVREEKRRKSREERAEKKEECSYPDVSQSVAKYAQSGIFSGK